MYINVRHGRKNEPLEYYEYHLVSSHFCTQKSGDYWHVYRQDPGGAIHTIATFDNAPAAQAYAYKALRKELVKACRVYSHHGTWPRNEQETSHAAPDIA